MTSYPLRSQEAVTEISGLSPAAQVERDPAAAGRRFIMALVCATVLPLPLMLLLPHAPGGAWTNGALRMAFMFSVAHVGMSGFFWVDRRYRRMITASPGEYYAVAALIAAGVVAGSCFIGARFEVLYSSLFLLWNTYHFSMQNWGLICMVAQGTGGPRPSGVEKLGCLVSGFAGWIGVLLSSDSGTLLDAGVHSAASRSGFYGLLVVLAVFVVIAIRQAAARMHPARVAMSLAVGGFFLPYYALTATNGVIAVGVAHAAQYLLVMLAIAGDRAEGDRLTRVSALAGVTALYIGFYLLMMNSAFWSDWAEPARDFLYAVVIWHYLLDAGLFRLSRPAQRAAMAGSFPFLFRKAAVAGKGG